jgi:hypothetical protein
MLIPIIINSITIIVITIVRIVAGHAGRRHNRNQLHHHHPISHPISNQLAYLVGLDVRHKVCPVLLELDDPEGEALSIRGGPVSRSGRFLRLGLLLSELLLVLRLLPLSLLLMLFVPQLELPLHLLLSPLSLQLELRILQQSRTDEHHTTSFPPQPPLSPPRIIIPSITSISISAPAHP